MVYESDYLALRGGWKVPKGSERESTRRAVMFIAFGVALLVATQNASALPSFARQTGMACAACHTIFPKLTPFGRIFKLNGYTMTGLQQIEQKTGTSAPGVKISAIAPMSAMIQVSLTHTNQTDYNTENNGISFPQPLSLYYAGAISAHVGAFMQVTMDDASSSFGFDMGDMRYANTVTTAGGLSILYGVTLDNMTGMEDVWNTTPAWTYPYLDASPDHGDSPAVNSLMGAGLGAYALVDNHWYAYVSVYHPMDNQKTSIDDAGMYMGNPYAENPYWRFAWQGNLGSDGYLEVGTYGTDVRVYGNGMTQAAAVATRDEFTDYALDAQYELAIGGSDQLNAHAVYIHEKQDLAASNPGATSQRLNQARFDVAYIAGGRFQYQLGYFATSGSDGANAFDGMMSNPYGGDNKGLVAQFDFMPWENTKLALQYTAFNTFGGTTDAASDNNALVASIWYMW